MKNLSDHYMTRATYFQLQARTSSIIARAFMHSGDNHLAALHQGSARIAYGQAMENLFKHLEERAKPVPTVYTQGIRFEYDPAHKNPKKRLRIVHTDIFGTEQDCTADVPYAETLRIYRRLWLNGDKETIALLGELIKVML